MIRGITRSRPNGWCLARSDGTNASSVPRQDRARPCNSRPYSDNPHISNPPIWSGVTEKSWRPKAWKDGGFPSEIRLSLGQSASNVKEGDWQSRAQRNGRFFTGARVSPARPANNARSDVETKWAHTGMLPLYEHPSLLDIDYVNSLESALEARNFDMTLRCFFAAVRKKDHDFIRAISQEQLSAILSILATHKSLGEISQLHQTMSKAHVRAVGTIPMHLVAVQHGRILREVWRVRRALRCSMSLESYKILLQNACDLGSGGLAKLYFRQLSHDGHVPDVACWNLLLEAQVYHSRHRASARFSTRATSRHVEMHETKTRTWPWITYTLGQKEGTLNTVVARLLDSMQESGVVADQHTYRISLVAAARMNDMAVAGEILKTAWGIDVSKWRTTSISADEIPSSGIIPPSEIDTKTLQVVTNAFLTMNEPVMALRAITFFQRCCKLDVPIAVWEDVWEHVYASMRDGRAQTRRRDKQRSAKPVVSLLSFEQMWKTILDPPNNVEPTMRMMYLYIKGLLIVGDVPQAFDMIRKYENRLYEANEQAKATWHKLSAARLKGDDSRNTLRQDWELVDTKVRLWTLWIRLLVQRTLACPQEHKLSMEETTLRLIPSTLPTLHRFLPLRIAYEVPGGLVEFDYHTIEGHARAEAYADQRRSRVINLQRDVPRLFGQNHHYDERVGRRKLGPEVIANNGSGNDGA